MLNDFLHFHFKLDLILFLLNDVPLSRVFTVTNSSQSFLTLRYDEKKGSDNVFCGRSSCFVRKKLATGEREDRKSEEEEVTCQDLLFVSFKDTHSLRSPSLRLLLQVLTPQQKFNPELIVPIWSTNPNSSPSFQVILIFLLRLLLHFFSYSLSSTSITTGSKLLDHPVKVTM